LKNVQKEHKPELEPEPCYKKRELRNRSWSHKNQELGSWIRSQSNFIFTTAL